MPFPKSYMFDRLVWSLTNNCSGQCGSHCAWRYHLYHLLYGILRCLEGELVFDHIGKWRPKSVCGYHLKGHFLVDIVILGRPIDNFRIDVIQNFWISYRMLLANIQHYHSPVRIWISVVFGFILLVYAVYDPDSDCGASCRWCDVHKP